MFSCVLYKPLLSFSPTECRDLVRSLLNPDQNERLTAEEAFRSPWCLKALYDNPSLSYLEDNLRPVSMRKPSECAPPETDKFGKFKGSFLYSV